MTYNVFGGTLSLTQSINRVCGTTYLSIYVTLNILSGVPPVTEDALVLLRIAAPSDCLFSCAL